MNPLYLSRAVLACYDNDNQAFIRSCGQRKVWRSSRENMVIANLVHRDFENEIRQFGDVVNTRRPARSRFAGRRDGHHPPEPGRHGHQRQGALGSMVLHELHHQGWRGQQVVPRPGGHLPPAGHDDDRPFRGPGRLGPRSRLSRTPSKRVGRLGNLSASNSKDFVLEARETLNVNKAPLEGRNLVLAPVSETALLKNELFIAAQMRGDFGTALESATLGRISASTPTWTRTSTASRSRTAKWTRRHRHQRAGRRQRRVADRHPGRLRGECRRVRHRRRNDQPTYITAKTSGAAQPRPSP